MITAAYIVAMKLDGWYLLLANGADHPCYDDARTPT